jgi:hypothetical protein
MNRQIPLKGCLVVLALLATTSAWTADVVPPVIEQPGTQPGEISNLESPDKCDNCHGGYNSAVEPAHNWRGSMMANASRDPIFWATLAIAEQDFDGAGDLCIRCHSTSGWLAGRSTPTDGSGLAQNDADGVECDYCHKLTNPDDSEHQGVMIHPFVANETNGNDGKHDWDAPNGIEGYHGSGMSSMWGGSDKLGPYNDADARHQFMLSLWHRDRDFCGTCHDVSNPAVGDLAPNHGAMLQQVVKASGQTRNEVAFNNPPYRYGVVERTFSEYKSSLIPHTAVDDFASLPEDLRGGALQQIWEIATANGTKSADYENPTATRYYSCQTCHMRPVTGTGANKRGVPVRDDLALHDMTGGNYWMPQVILWMDDRGLLRLGGGLSDTQRVALADGALRAKEQLRLAATLTVDEQANTVKIVNHTGHKLISGYPEGRRMWLNVRWYDGAGAVLREDGTYGPYVDANGDPVTVPDADGIQRQVSTLLNPATTKVYEAHMGMTRNWVETVKTLIGSTGVLAFEPTITDPADSAHVTVGDFLGGAGDSIETFHFVLNNAVLKDNRIPPYGMDFNLAEERNALPVPADQFGNPKAGDAYDYFDIIGLNPPTGAVSADISLMYQPTSWEYIQFLWLANEGENAFLADEGQHLLHAWLATGMAEPFVMAEATWGGGSGGGGCGATTPALLSADGAHQTVSLAWEGDAANSAIAGYKVYYDQAQKGQAITTLPCVTPDQGDCTAYTDTGLTNGQSYCYKITSYATDTNGVLSCESAFSNTRCGTPENSGTNLTITAVDLRTGHWVTSGKGKNQTTTFEPAETFSAGDEVVIAATVQASSGAAVADAIVTFEVSGAVTTLLDSGASDGNGFAEATWATERPHKKQGGGTPSGAYTVTVVGVSAGGYAWDDAKPSVQITIQ